MTRFADPNRCPNCRSTLPGGAQQCTTCRLDLSGPLGAELFVTLTRADELLDRLKERSRAATAVREPVSVGAAPAAPAASGLDSTSLPAYPSSPPAAPTPTVRASSVPKILLGLGAVCLLVAALVFLAVTWSVLGVGGRTATLLGFTLATAALTGWVARRGLRGATEALGLVTIGLASLDLLGARSAGWLGEPTDAGFAAVIGGALVAGGCAATRALGRTAVRGFTTGELAAVVGAALLAGGVGNLDWWAVSAQPVVATVVAGLLAVGGWLLARADAPRFRLAAWGASVVAVLSWLFLVVAGLERVGTSPTIASTWRELEGWQLLAAAVLALAVSGAREVLLPLRVTAAGAALVALGFVVAAPAADAPLTTALLVLLAVLAMATGYMFLAPRPWAAAGLGLAFFASVFVVLETGALLAQAGNRYAEVATHAWAGSTGGRLRELSGFETSEPTLLPVCVVLLLLAAWTAARLTEAGRALPLRRVLAVLGGAVAFSLVATLVLHPVPVWTVMATLLIAAAALGVVALLRDDPRLHAAAGVVLVAGVLPSFFDERLTAVALSVAVLVAAALHLRTSVPATAAAAGAALPLLLAGLVWTVGVIGAGEGTWVALLGIVVVAVLGVGRGSLRFGTRPDGVLVAVEVAAAAAVLPLMALGTAAASTTDRPGWTAVYLTVAGAAATLLSLLRPDRRHVGWLGGLLLVLATWVRLDQVGVDEPEPYTLPAALALLVVGVLRLRRDPEASTLGALGAGLSLALVPSLVWVLDDPVSLRGVVLGLVALGLVVAGAQLRWAAPLVFGAVVGLLVVLREAGPYLGDSVPRWALIAGAGALLIGLGITWEQRMREARAVSRYLTHLR